MCQQGDKELHDGGEHRDSLFESGDRTRIAGCQSRWSTVTTSPTPRRIQLSAVRGGISSSGTGLGFAVRTICSLMRWS
jgi:hypothetical protein